MFWKVVCSSSNKVRVRNNNYHNYKSIFSSILCGKKVEQKTLWLFLLLLDSLCDWIYDFDFSTCEDFSENVFMKRKKTKKSTVLHTMTKGGGLSYQQTECKKSLIIFEEWIIWEKPMLQVQVLDLIRERFLCIKVLSLKGSCGRLELHFFFI